MARRDLLKHTVWLGSLASDPLPGCSSFVDAEKPLSTEKCISALNYLGYMVEIWKEEEQFRARCYQLRAYEQLSGVRLALSYKDSQLQRLLNIMVFDADRLYLVSEPFLSMPREAIRWAKY